MIRLICVRVSYFGDRYNPYTFRPVVRHYRRENTDCERILLLTVTTETYPDTSLRGVTQGIVGCVLGETVLGWILVEGETS